MTKSGKPTIKDLAEKAGVSKTAVSFAFNSPERISSETYQRIMEIAEKMGYSPDPVARILAKRETKSIGILLPQSIPETFQNPYITEILRGIGSVCDREGLSILVLSPFKGIIAHTILNAAVDGLVIIGVTGTSDVHAVCRQRNMPYVTIDAGQSSDYVNVGIDDKSAARKLTEMLLEHGHRRICVCTLEPISTDLTDTASSETMQARRAGIFEAARHELAENAGAVYFVDTGATYERAYQIALQELKRKDRPTAVCCMAAIQAYGFYRAVRDVGLSIPEDVSVVTFDALPMSSVLYPQLTAVNQPGFEKGEAAAGLLVKLIAGEACRSVVLDSDIWAGNSVAAVNG
ncbi:LacI family DNA-binding transcriptional regulator [Treponema brennaborense]|uniref:Transcriptional regulator, LacI family n=1 Tax=Treponema brennaborense (strain DSM 12168 / CIP 105900 / DD5/3) TaxID=906968 RepID=F4LP20_TREBD|nr:LacI family DNA-binding transcriptional regulator [Treponema brennaborense]AEE15896.1 transcriptional regulator, LacI family [Treponema brennaborense DSM 12168]